MVSGRRALVWSTSMSFIFWGIIGTIGPLIASGTIIGKLGTGEKVMFLLVGPVTVPFGNLVMGLLADRFGRKRVFIITMISYTFGIIVISLSYTMLPLLIGLIFAEFGVGGEEPSSLALMGEETDEKSRPRLLTLMTNYDNVGSAIMSGLFFVVVVEVQDRLVLLVGSLLLIIAMLYLRTHIPESRIWKKYRNTSKDDKDTMEGAGQIDHEAKGKSEPSETMLQSTSVNRVSQFRRKLAKGNRNKGNPGYPFIFSFLGIIAVSQYLTFGLMAYVLAPIEFPNPSEDTLIIFIAMLGASFAGFVAAPLISRGTKSYTLYAFLFGTVTMIAIILLTSHLSNMIIFLPLLFANMFASEFAYASRSVLEPELFGTRSRSTFIGITRLWPMIAYPIFTLYTSALNLQDFLGVNLILWGMGLGAAIMWYIYGIETKNMSMDYER